MPYGFNPRPLGSETVTLDAGPPRSTIVDKIVNSCISRLHHFFKKIFQNFTIGLFIFFKLFLLINEHICILSYRSVFFLIKRIIH